MKKRGGSRRETRRVVSDLSLLCQKLVSLTFSCPLWPYLYLFQSLLPCLLSSPTGHCCLKGDCAGSSYGSHIITMNEQSNAFFFVTWKAKTNIHFNYLQTCKPPLSNAIGLPEAQALPQCPKAIQKSGMMSGLLPSSSTIPADNLPKIRSRHIDL